VKPAINQSAHIRTLGEFIKENDKLLGAIGVLIALSTFLSSSPLGRYSSFLSFCCVVATLPLLFEFFLELNRAKNSWNLLVFSNILFLFGIKFCWAVLIAYRPQWHEQMHQVVFWTIFLSLLALYKLVVSRWYLRLFKLVGPIVEKVARLAWIYASDLQVRYRIHIHFFELVYVYHYLPVLAARWKFRALLGHKLENRKNVEGMKDELSRRWQRDELSERTKWLVKAVLFVILWFVVGFYSGKIADYINYGLDIKAEELRHIDAEHGALNIEPVPLPRPELHD